MTPNLDVIQDLLRHLGVLPTEVENLYTLAYPEATKLLGVLKDRVRRNWRKLAFELHPDRTNNDPEKTRQFRALLALKDRFEQLTLPEPRSAHPDPSTLYTTMPPTPGVIYGQVRVRPPRPSQRRTGHVAANMKP